MNAEKCKIMVSNDREDYTDYKCPSSHALIYAIVPGLKEHQAFLEKTNLVVFIGSGPFGFFWG